MTFRLRCPSQDWRTGLGYNLDSLHNQSQPVAIVDQYSDPQTYIAQLKQFQADRFEDLHVKLLESERKVNEERSKAAQFEAQLNETDLKLFNIEIEMKKLTREIAVLSAGKESAEKSEEAWQKYDDDQKQLFESRETKLKEEMKRKEIRVLEDLEEKESRIQDLIERNSQLEGNIRAKEKEYAMEKEKVKFEIVDLTASPEHDTWTKGLFKAEVDAHSEEILQLKKQLEDNAVVTSDFSSQTEEAAVIVSSPTEISPSGVTFSTQTEKPAFTLSNSSHTSISFRTSTQTEEPPIVLANSTQTAISITTSTQTEKPPLTFSNSSQTSISYSISTQTEEAAVDLTGPNQVVQPLAIFPAEIKIEPSAVSTDIEPSPPAVPTEPSAALPLARENSPSAKRQRTAEDYQEPSKEKYVCSDCGKGYNNRGSLSHHRSSKHSSVPIACPICDKRFGRRDSMLRHQKGHEVATAKASKN